MQDKLYCLIYELKGIIDSMTSISGYDDQFDNPLIEDAHEKMQEIMESIKN